MNNELKPCPFCGGEADILEVNDDTNNFHGYVACCLTCGCGTPGSEDEAECCAVWNNRHP